MSVPVLDLARFERVERDKAAEFDALITPAKTPVAPRLIEESIYNEAKHPRWPAGSVAPDGEHIGGKFMTVGQRFNLDGHDWEIAHVAMGNIIANEASGKITKAETRIFEGKPEEGTLPSFEPLLTIPGAVPSKMKKLVGGSSSSSYKTKGNTPIVDVDAHPETHDKTIPIPPESDLTPVEWQRFGRVDQMLYTELESRFGKWAWGGPFTENNNDSAAGWGPQKARKDKILSEYSDEIKQIVEGAYQDQYGSSDGDVLDLTKVFEQWEGSPAKLAVATEKYQKARELQGELRDLNAWDLMNRTHSPDVFLMHTGQGGHNFYDSIVSGDDPVMSGMSSSWKPGAWTEKNTLAFAVPARHIAMATDVVGYVSMQHEREMATADRLRLNPENAHFWTKDEVPEGSPAKQWLDAQVPGEPVSGSVLRMFAAYRAGAGELPLPPEKPNLSYASFFLKQTPGGGWEEVPGAVAEAKWVKPPPSVLAKVKKLAPAAKPGELLPNSQLGLKPGDMIMGKKGRRYLMLADTQSADGLAYLYLNDDGSADFAKVFNFGSGASAFHKLDAHVVIPVKKPPKAVAAPPPFDKDAWAEGGESVPLGKMVDGDRFLISGVPFEVIPGDGGSSLVNLVDLSSLKKAAASSVFKAPLLFPKAGYVPPLVAPQVLGVDGKPVFVPKLGDKVFRISSIEPYIGGVVDIGEGGQQGQLKLLRPDGVAAWVFLSDVKPYEPPGPSKAEKGDVFEFEGVKHTVTTVTKYGAIKAKPSGGGPVKPFAPPGLAVEIPGVPTIKSEIVRPGEWEIGPKVTLGSLKVGDLFSGSGVNVRPYQVLAVGAGLTFGSKVYWKNLETGVIGKNLKHKSFYGLHKASEMYPPPLAANSLMDKLALKAVLIGDLPSASDAMTDPGTLTDAVESGVAVPYLHHKSGTAKHFKVAAFGKDGQFVDKQGKVFKVKQSGAVPIITDGVHHYTVPAGAWWKKLEDAKGAKPLNDLSPPASGLEKVFAGGLITNHQQVPLSALDLGFGDKLMLAGKPYIVQEVDKNTAQVKATKVAVGAEPEKANFVLDGGLVPEKIPAKHSALLPVLEPGDSPSLPSQMENNKGTNGKKLNLTQLPVGAFYAWKEGSHFKIKKILKAGPSPLVDDGSHPQKPSPGYIPMYVWIPPKPAVVGDIFPAEHEGFAGTLKNGDTAWWMDPEDPENPYAKPEQVKVKDNFALDGTHLLVATPEHYDGDGFFVKPEDLYPTHATAQFKVPVDNAPPAEPAYDPEQIWDDEIFGKPEVGQEVVYHSLNEPKALTGVIKAAKTQLSGVQQYKIGAKLVSALDLAHPAPMDEKPRTDLRVGDHFTNAGGAALMVTGITKQVHALSLDTGGQVHYTKAGMAKNWSPPVGKEIPAVDLKVGDIYLSGGTTPKVFSVTSKQPTGDIYVVPTDAKIGFMLNPATQDMGKVILLHGGPSDAAA